MRELVAGVGVLALCLIGSMENARSVSSGEDLAECSGDDAISAHGMAISPVWGGMVLPMAPNLDCMDVNVPVNTVISNDMEARSVCRSACEIAGGWWNGSWQAVIGGNLSFCGCRMCQSAS